MDALGPLGAMLAGFRSRLAAVEAKVGIVPPADGGGDEDEVAPYVLEFDALLKSKLEPFVASSDKIGNAAAQLVSRGGSLILWHYFSSPRHAALLPRCVQGAAVQKSFNAQRAVLSMVAKCKKPSPADIVSIPARSPFVPRRYAGWRTQFHPSYPCKLHTPCS
jgi:hypothetical protein